MYFTQVTEKGTKYKKCLRVVEVLKIFNRVIIITKQIFLLNTNLIIKKLLTLAFIIQKLFTKVIIKDKTIQFYFKNPDIKSYPKPASV